MEDEYQTLEANPDVSGTENVSTAEGTQNDVVPVTTTPDALTVDEINALTGHKYASSDEARRGIKNLSSFVGKKEIKVVDPTLVEKVETLEKTLKANTFYETHPELRPHKEFLAKFGDPDAAIKDPVVKKALDAMSREEAEPLTSNSRIAEVANTTYAQDFARAKTTGAWTPFLKKYKGFDIK